MRTALLNPAPLALVALVCLAACTEATGPRVHRLRPNSSETLAAGVTLAIDSSVSWNVSMPSSGTIRLSFDGRIDFPATAGNGTILQIRVNGMPVDASALYNKSSTYTYSVRGGMESYYENRGSPWGQSAPHWGLFWSPDFVSNHTPGNFYHVQQTDAYTFVLTLDDVVNPGRVNTIELANRGGWVQTATGSSPSIVLRDVVVTAS